MSFGSPQPELMPGARNAVETCLAVRPGEHVALIADEARRMVAASLAAALDERRALLTGLLLEDFGPRPMRAAPAQVLSVLETADVGVMCVTPQPGELAARMAIVRVVERRQIRYAHMVGVTPQIMQQGMRADYRMVDRLSEKLRERMLRAEMLIVKTEDGTFVCDATAGDHFNGKYGDLQSTPLTLTIKAARLVDAACARKDLEQEFW